MVFYEKDYYFKNFDSLLLLKDFDYSLNSVIAFFSMASCMTNINQPRTPRTRLNPPMEKTRKSALRRITYLERISKR
jgi:hypothetical protein